MAYELQPYVGPRPFEKDDRALFFGRDREVSELLSLIIAHDLVLVYAQSGAGKTSLLNAGLIPRLEAEGIEVLPLDLDGDGVVAEEESFYEDRDAIVDAIASGKYPSPPARDLHFVCHGKPGRKVVRAFILWVLTDGQQYVPESGYINLTEEKLAEEIAKIAGE